MTHKSVCICKNETLIGIWEECSRFYEALKNVIEYCECRNTTEKDESLQYEEKAFLDVLDEMESDENDIVDYLEEEIEKQERLLSCLTEKNDLYTTISKIENYKKDVSEIKQALCDIDFLRRCCDASKSNKEKQKWEISIS